MPLKTREGVADAPIEPGLRTLCEPCVTGPRLKLCRLIVPWKPLPIEIPVTLTFSPGSKASTVTVSPGTSSLGPRISTSLPVRPDPVLGQMPELGLRELSLGHLVERELDGVVAVGLGGPHGDDGAGPRLDHRHGREPTGLLVEDLRHAELLADDALHLRPELDLDVDACRKIEPHEGVDRLRGRRVDVDQALVRAHLEVLAGVLVLERASDHRVDVLLGGQGHRPGHGRAGALRRLDDRQRRPVELGVVVPLETDADLLLRQAVAPIPT